MADALSVAELALITGYTKTNIRNMINSGLIVATRAGKSFQVDRAYAQRIVPLLRTRRRLQTSLAGQRNAIKRYDDGRAFSAAQYRYREQAV